MIICHPSRYHMATIFDIPSYCVPSGWKSFGRKQNDDMQILGVMWQTETYLTIQTYQDRFTKRQHARGAKYCQLLVTIQWIANNVQRPLGSGVIWIWNWIIAMSLLSTCRPFRDRQKAASGTWCLYTLIKKLGIYYIHYHQNMIAHSTAVGEPVCGTGSTN